MTLVGCSKTESHIGGIGPKEAQRHEDSTLGKDEAALAKVKWGKYEDATVEVQFSNTDINVNEDGTYEGMYELQVKILKEPGRNLFAKYSSIYRANAASHDILDAKSIYNGQEYVVTKDMIEDKPIASVGQGFDDMNQITIAFPRVELDTVVYIKGKIIAKKVPCDNFYSYLDSFDAVYNRIVNPMITAYWQAKNTKINSKLALEIKVNDPRNVLKVVNEKRNNIHSIQIALAKPTCEYLINEPGAGVLNFKHRTWVLLSSLSKWEDLAKKLAPAYHNVMNQPLPALFMAIVQSAAAANKDGDEEKINFITSLLNEKIQYMGDWRTVSGCYYPRNLEQIASSHVGDCKDFAISTAAILQKLGYTVQPILVKRGLGSTSDPDALPNLDNFNHAMLRVSNKNGKIYWIDPTNSVSMAQGIFPDIANKMALILDAKEVSYSKIPDVQPLISKTITHNELTIQDNIVDTHGTMVIKGESAFPLVESGLDCSDTQLRDCVFSLVSHTKLDEEEKKFLALPDLNTRIVKDLTIKYAFQQKNKLLKSNSGPVLSLEQCHLLRRVLCGQSDQMSDLFIGPPKTDEKHMIIKDIKIKNCERLNFEINSPWLYVKRLSTHRVNGTEIIDIVSIRKSFITNEELKSIEYRNLKRDVENNFRSAALIINE